MAGTSRPPTTKPSAFRLLPAPTMWFFAELLRHRRAAAVRSGGHRAGDEEGSDVAFLHSAADGGEVFIRPDGRWTFPHDVSRKSVGRRVPALAPEHPEQDVCSLITPQTAQSVPSGVIASPMLSSSRQVGTSRRSTSLAAAFRHPPLQWAARTPANPSCQRSSRTRA